MVGVVREDRGRATAGHWAQLQHRGGQARCGNSLERRHGPDLSCELHRLPWTTEGRVKVGGESRGVSGQSSDEESLGRVRVVYVELQSAVAAATSSRGAQRELSTQPRLRFRWSLQSQSSASSAAPRTVYRRQARKRAISVADPLSLVRASTAAAGSAAGRARKAVSRDESSSAPTLLPPHRRYNHRLPDRSSEASSDSAVRSTKGRMLSTYGLGAASAIRDRTAEAVCEWAERYSLPNSLLGPAGSSWVHARSR